MTIRLADDKDLQNIYDLYMEPDANPYLTYDPMPILDFSEIYKELVDSNTLFIVEINNSIVASYRLIPKLYRQAHVYYLGSFVVKKDMTGKGIGAWVLQKIKEYSNDHGKSRIELTVDLHNHSAIHLYKKSGFEIEGTVKKSYRLKSTGKFYDEYLMACILPEEKLYK